MVLFPNLADEHGVPVVLCLHDQNEAEVYGASFAAFVQRVMLEAFACIPREGLEDFAGDAELRRHLQLCIDAVAPVLRSNWSARLRELASRPFHASDMDSESLAFLSTAELERVIATDVAVGRAGDKFEHMQASGGA